MKIILMALVCLNVYASDLTIKVTGFRSDRGQVQLALWNNQAGFPEDYSSAYVTVTEKAERTFKTTVKDLDPGTYAVAMYHDKNSDFKLNKNFLGIPREGFGFSNNPTILTGAPSFTKVKFTITEQDKTITIKLKHF